MRGLRRNSSAPPEPPHPRELRSLDLSPAGRGEGTRKQAIPFSRRMRVRKVLTRGNDRPEIGPRFSASPNNEGSGAPNGAGGRELYPLPGTAPAFMTKAGHLSVLHDRIDGSCLPPRPGPALPGITGCKRQWAFRPPSLRRQCSEHLAVRTHAGRA